MRLKELHIPHPEEVHVTKAKPSKKGDHALHQVPPLEIDECQPSSQWGNRGRDEPCVSYILPPVFREDIVEFEVLGVREKPNEVRDPWASASGPLESKKSKHWREVPEALLDGRQEAGHIEIVYSQLLEVRKGGEVTQGTPVEPCRSEQHEPPVVQMDPEWFDEWEQTKLVRFFEWLGQLCFVPGQT